MYLCMIRNPLQYIWKRNKFGFDRVSGFIFYQDRREFAKFEREQQNARYNTSENPIYKTATTTFQNPTYGGKGWIKMIL